LKNWGTKWNACETEIGDNYFTFETAWSSPVPLFEALTRKFPSYRFMFQWSDEDLGSNVGWIGAQNGKIDFQGSFEDCSEDAYKLACDLWDLDFNSVWEDTKCNNCNNEETQELCC
jgi:hypothetical protein